MKPIVGFIGLGTMGLPMAERLLHAGFSMVVYNRTASKADPLVKENARRAESSEDVARASDVCITMVSDPEALEQTVFGPNGLDAGLSSGKIHIDMSTVSPVIVEKLSKHYASRKIGFLHAPVLGSVPQAADGSLLIFVGGDSKTYDRVRDVLSVLGTHQWHFENPAQATHLKLICNTFIASMIMPLIQGLVLGTKVGIQPSLLLDVLSHSSLNSPMYQTKGKSIAERKFSPARFYGEHLLKDINLALDAGKRAGVPLPGLAPIREMFVAAAAMGYSKEDYSAVVKVLETLAGVAVTEKKD